MLARALCACWTAVPRLEGHLTVDVLYMATTYEARDQSWHTDIEKLWGVVLDNVNVCVSELEGTEAMLRSAAHQLDKLTQEHTRAHQMYFFCLYPRKAVPVTHTCSIHMTGANLILGLSRNRLLG